MAELIAGAELITVVLAVVLCLNYRRQRNTIKRGSIPAKKVISGQITASKITHSKVPGDGVIVRYTKLQDDHGPMDRD
jgi:hypothetical protein